MPCGDPLSEQLIRPVPPNSSKISRFGKSRMALVFCASDVNGKAVSRSSAAIRMSLTAW